MARWIATDAPEAVRVTSHQPQPPSLVFAVKPTLEKVYESEVGRGNIGLNFSAEKFQLFEKFSAENKKFQFQKRKEKKERTFPRQQTASPENVCGVKNPIFHQKNSFDRKCSTCPT